MIHIIGAGGTGGWLCRLLRKTVQSKDWRIYDKDVWELKNLDRQFFNESDIGCSKAMSLAATIGLPLEVAVIEWFGPAIEVKIGDVLFCCADNHPARVACLNAVDNGARMAIICGNELVSAQAYVYMSKMKTTRLDPRVRYPELLTNHAGDPSRPCTGAYQEQNKQLALSNYMAAGYGVWLYWYWMCEHMKCRTNEGRVAAPVEVMSGVSGMITTQWKDLENAK